jgi:hypothetical protein
MGLREVAEEDLLIIMEDDDIGFGWPITLTDPADVSVNLVGFSDDISQVIDPDTGQAVSGRLASVALRISTLLTTGIGLPQGIADLNSKPWRVTFDDINGTSHIFKISQSNPDRALGVVTCVLERYDNS